MLWHYKNDNEGMRRGKRLCKIISSRRRAIKKKEKKKNVNENEAAFGFPFSSEMKRRTGWGELGWKYQYNGIHGGWGRVGLWIEKTFAAA